MRPPRNKSVKSDPRRVGGWSLRARDRTESVRPSSSPTSTPSLQPCVGKRHRGCIRSFRIPLGTMPRNASFDSTVVVPGPVVPVLRRFGEPPLSEHKPESQGPGWLVNREIGFFPPAEQLPSSRKPGPAIAVAPGRSGAIDRALRTAAPYSSILLQPGVYTVRGGARPPNLQTRR